MCNDEGYYKDITVLDNPQEVSLGDGRVLKATAEGTVSLQMLLTDGTKKRCNLGNVLLIPKLAYNLLSISKVSDAGKTVKFDDEKCEISNSRGECIAIGNLYYLQFDRQQQQHLNVVINGNKERLWHRRYGHMGEQSLHRLVRDGLVEDFDYNIKCGVGFCESCIKGRHHKSRFEGSKTHTSELLELVHTDVCGKMGEKSIGGAEYFISFIYDKSHYVWTYPLKTKDQAFNKFVEWKIMAERESGKKLKILRSDNGGEYKSKEFEDYLKSEGIHHQCTIPKTPQQNGVAERFNRTVVESCRSMSQDAQLSHKFWAEAISTSTYLRNRSPTKAVDGMTPYEAWHDIKPRVDHLRVFGCDAYMHVPKDERGKLDPKSKKCILLGYGRETKGYRLFDITRQKVVHSRDVQFNEEEKKDSNNAPNNSNTRVEVELQCDPDLTHDDHEASDVAPTEESEIEPVVRRSTRERHPPDYFRMHSTCLTFQQDPSSFEEATTCSNKSEWIKAMECEIQSLNCHNVWDVVPLPEGKKAVGRKWVYKIKKGSTGTTERYKARLVAQGCSQQQGADYDETFSPVVRLESFRMLLALSIQRGLKLHHVDVTTAFLNGELSEEVYMKQPKGFTIEGKDNLVCKLNKSIYGLRQSSRCWNLTLDSRLREMGFSPCASDPCIYMATGGDGFCIGVYVDDMVLAGQSDERIQEVKNALSQHFDIKDLGKLRYFLGITVEQDEARGVIKMGQPTYTRNVLEKFGMQNCNPVCTPVDVNTKLTKASKSA